MKLVFLHGMPGVGKLTVARELAKLIGFKVFHNHLTVDLVTSLFEFGTQPFIELRERIWLDTFAHAAAANLNGLIFTFAFEKTVREEFITNATQTVEGAGGQIIFVRLWCEIDELEQRITNPTRAEFGKLNSLDLFRELNSGGTFETPHNVPDRLVINTTRISPSEVAQRIATELILT